MDSHRNNNHYGGGGGNNRHHYRNNNRRGGYRGGRGGGRGRGHRHSPYNGRGGGPRRSGNRFQQPTQIDPHTLMMRKVATFVSRVGEFKNLKASTATLRAVEVTTASNIMDLVPVLLDQDKVETLLQPHTAGNPKVVTKLVHLVVSCVAALPLQTPGYVALTLAIHEQLLLKQQRSLDFASQCLEFVMSSIGREVDACLLSSRQSPNERAKATCRVKLLLRYVTLLGQTGMVKVYDETTSSSFFDPSNMTIMTLLQVLVQASQSATKRGEADMAHWLAFLVLSTVPYLRGVPTDVIQTTLLIPLQGMTYESNFQPGKGLFALLLPDPELEDDAEEEEDDEEEDEGGGAAICDTLQDLMRTCAIKEDDNGRFCLPKDAPWKGLVVASKVEGDDTPPPSVVQFSGSPLSLKFVEECQSLNLLINGSNSTGAQLQWFDLRGAVFGRLPIFGSPPDPEEEEDDDDEEEEEMDKDAAPKNESLAAFQAMSVADRYFVAETIRDCLISHQSMVTAAGVQYGSAKTAAEEVWSVSHTFATAENTQHQGMEYAIMETILSMIAQAGAKSALSRVFLSRVLLELVRLEPAKVSPALAVGMTNIFQDYLPALVPVARDNLCQWFAFHLANTDYQWPSAYWSMCEPHASENHPSSRNYFVRRTLNLLLGNVADPSVLTKLCLSSAPSLTKSLFWSVAEQSTEEDESNPTAKLQQDLFQRINENGEDEKVVQSLFENAVTTDLGTGGPLMPEKQYADNFPRSDILVRVVLDPAVQLQKAMQTAFAKQVSEANDDDMMVDSDLSKDTFAAISERLKKLKPAILEALSKDVELLAEASGQSVDTLNQLGAAFMLRRIQNLTSFDLGLLDGVALLFVEQSIVSPIDMVRWSLGDFGSTVGSSSEVVPRWWWFAGEAARLGAASVEQSNSTVFVLDNGGAATMESQVATQVAQGLSQLMKYAVGRVCRELASRDSGKKSLSHVQIELLEGLKTFTWTCQDVLVSMLTFLGKNQPMTKPAIREILGSVGITGPALASSCGDSGATTRSTLTDSLKML